MKTRVLARLTAYFADSRRQIIEVHDDATVDQFYRFYFQDGARWSTKRLAYTKDRCEGIHPHYRRPFMQPGIELVAESLRRQAKAVPHLFPLLDIRIRILRKRAYQRLLEAPGVLKTVTIPAMPDPRIERASVSIPVQIPTPKKRAYSVLTGWSR